MGDDVLGESLRGELAPRRERRVETLIAVELGIAARLDEPVGVQTEGAPGASVVPTFS